MRSQATTVAAYLKELPPDRRETIKALRDVILENLPEGYVEGIGYGMISYVVPHSLYPDGYHCDPKQPLPFISLASQKNHLSLYMFCIYTDPQEQERFCQAWRDSGKKLDMGKSCVRFKKLDDVPLDVIAEQLQRLPVEKFVANYEAQVADLQKRPESASRVSKQKSIAKRVSTAKTAKKAVQRKTTKRKSSTKATRSK
jgi:uncharacterized protein YdhG (YjbR/CyaY superfamily)